MGDNGSTAVIHGNGDNAIYFTAVVTEREW